MLRRTGGRGENSKSACSSVPTGHPSVLVAALLAALALTLLLGSAGAGAAVGDVGFADQV